MPLWLNSDHDPDLIHYHLLLNPVAPPLRVGKACFARTITGISVDPHRSIQTASLMDRLIVDTPATEAIEPQGTDLFRENLEEFTGQPGHCIRLHCAFPLWILLHSLGLIYLSPCI
jgi:hypothetical protein